MRFHIYIWRPSTGAIVGRINDLPALTGCAEPGAFNSERVNQGTIATSTGVAALTGDVIICEVWEQHTQATSVAFTSTFFFDGTTTNTTTNNVVSNHAAFLDFATDTLTFQTIATGNFSNTLATVALSANGTVSISGSFTNTLATVTLAATGKIPVAGSFSNTLGAATLAATGKVGLSTGSFSNTLAASTLTGTGTVSVSGSFTNTLATITLAATGNALANGAFSNTLAVASLSAAGTVTSGASANGVFANTLTGASINAAGTTGTPPVLVAGYTAVSAGGASQRKKFRVPDNAPFADYGKALHEILGVTPKESPDNPNRESDLQTEPMTFTRLIGSTQITIEPVLLPQLGSPKLSDEDDDIMIFLLQYL